MIYRFFFFTFIIIYFNFFQTLSLFSNISINNFKETPHYTYSNQYILFLLEINNNELQNFKTKKNPYACLIRTVIYYILLILRDYRRLQELQNLGV